MDAIELRRIWGGFQAARVLMTAVNLGMFERLRKPADSDAVAASLKLDPRAAGIVLDALAAMGLIKKSKSVYSLTPDAARLLLNDAPEYQGDIIRHADGLWRGWSSLDEIMLTGRPAGRGGDHRAFIMGMHNLAKMKAPRVLNAVGLRGVKRALDLGGGPGTYSIEMARKGIQTTLFDIPETVAIARTVARGSGARFLSGDFLTDPIGRGYDLIFISQILHAFSEDDCRELLIKCAGALAPGGRIAIQEFPISPTLDSPLPGALFSVNMLVNTTGGRCYAKEELASWLGDAGLVRIKHKDLKETVLVIGSKR